MTRSNNISELRKLFAEGKNLMESLRKGDGGNSQDTIMLSYDLQAGSYTEQVNNSETVRANKFFYGKFMSNVLQGLNPYNILDAGTGEATSLFFLLNDFKPRGEVYAFDISLSRLLFAKIFLSSGRHEHVALFTGSLDNIPLETSSIDIVITNHALEPNGGREEILIKELMRVAGRYIVLVEPSWELGSASTRAHISEHRYVIGLPEILKSMGAVIRRHELWAHNINPSNEAALIVAEMPGCGQWNPRRAVFRSPIGFGSLEDREAYFYSKDDGFLFPKVEGVPCLLRDHGILAARLDEAIRAKSST